MSKYVRLDQIELPVPTKVFEWGNIVFVPEYSGHNYVGPGFHKDKNPITFTEEKLYAMGAKVASRMLWKRNVPKLGD